MPSNITSAAPLQILESEIELTVNFVFDGAAAEVVGITADDMTVVTRTPDLPIVLSVRFSVTGQYVQVQDDKGTTVDVQLEIYNARLNGFK